MKKTLVIVFLSALVAGCTRETCKVDWKGEVMISALAYVKIWRCDNPLEIYQDLDSGYNYRDPDILRIKANKIKYHLKRGEPAVVEDYHLTFSGDTTIKEPNLIYKPMKIIYAEPVQ